MKYGKCLLILLILAGCSAKPIPPIKHSVPKKEIQQAKTIVIIQLLEGSVQGIFPLKKRGLEIKKEINLSARAHNRAYLHLKGKIIDSLKGVRTGNINFKIFMGNLIADRNGHVLAVEGSNIPDLIIGEKYLILLDEKDELIHNNIFKESSGLR